MSIWTHINGTLTFQVPLFRGNTITTYEETVEHLKAHFEPFRTYYNGDEFDNVNLPQGSEGSVKYYFTDMTDYARNQHIQKNFRNSETIEVGVVLTGNLRDYYDEEELTNWIKSLDSLITDEYKIILDNGIITTNGLEGQTYFRYTGIEWLEKKED
jgi:hypothetical protein